MNPVYLVPSYFCKINFDVIFLTMTGSLESSFLLQASSHKSNKHEYHKRVVIEATNEYDDFSINLKIVEKENIV